ncbi:MAG: formylglycine-generating enzyme family protein [Planctomycetota bacterium]|nr:formylglycine-generating enzyme family protein [Planctomycetota bacterium]
MAWIPGGTFQMGDGTLRSDSRPVHAIRVDGFWMDTTAVTNEAFARFVAATGYITVAERVPDAKDFPGADPETLVPGALVFTPPETAKTCCGPMDWWRFVPGANWRRPQGPASGIAGLERHPVVQVCWEDAQAYAAWAGKRLPTEAEWECAARGGLDRQPYAWGARPPEQLKRWPANLWQGTFPSGGKAEDGFAGTAPVGSFPANGYGLFDMSGNVWQWCADWYAPDYYAHAPSENPPGPPRSEAYDPDEPGVKKRVMRGGSFLCHDSYCSGYRPGARMKSTPDTALCHTGFRCVKSAE